MVLTQSFRFLPSLVLLAHSISVSAWTPLSSSRTVQIGSSSYYIPSEPVQILPDTFASTSKSNAGKLIALTVVSTNASYITSSYLDGVVGDYKTQDDVYDDGFLQSLLINYDGANGTGIASLDGSVNEWVSRHGVEFVLTSGVRGSEVGAFVTSPVDAPHLPPGPYVIGPDAEGRPAIYEVHKLYWDNTQSFHKSVIRSPSTNTFTTVSATLDTDASPYIAVPSRLYTSQVDASKKPLAGLRVGVKDIYHLAGVKTGAGNRAFYAIYGPRNATAPSVQRLIDLGATMVGKTKTVQFANGDRDVDDWVDYHVPFVSRGDGYDQGSGSSTGSGTAMSGYEWLDAALGTDTGGSVRGPAGANGLYGMRPSTGAITTDNVVPLSDALDSLGVITRSPYIFSTFVKNWYGDHFADYSSFPKKLYVSANFTMASNKSLPVYQAFLQKLEGFLGATRTDVNIFDLWNRTSGIQTAVDSYMNATYPTLITYHQWNTVGKQLFSDYQSLMNNRTPHINPGVLVRWVFGQSVTQAAYQEQLDRRQQFEDWVSQHLFKADEESCSDAIYAYPQNDGDYISQQTYYGSTVPLPFGFADDNIANFGRVPDLVIPIGQVPYMSNITNVIEYMPVSISLVVRRNCDYVLANLAKALADAGIVTTVQTGRYTFPPSS